eukprot:scaffold82174_cov74-Phaeocystis_antarctica.AAC.1
MLRRGAISRMSRISRCARRRAIVLHSLGLVGAAQVWKNSGVLCGQAGSGDGKGGTVQWRKSERIIRAMTVWAWNNPTTTFWHCTSC